MAISSEVRKSDLYVCDGTQTKFSFAFKLLSTDDVSVHYAPPDGVDTVLPTNLYTCTLNEDQDNAPGGYVTLAEPLAAKTTLVVMSAARALQPAVFTNHGAFYPTVLNDSLDRLTILVQQLLEKLTRAVTVAETDTRTPSQLLDDIFDTEKAGQASAAASAQSAAESKKYSDAVTAFKSEIVTTANNIAVVKVNAENIGSIQTTAANITAVETTASNIDAVKTNAANASAIVTNAGNIGNIQTVAGNIDAVKTNATNVASIVTNAQNMGAIKAVDAERENIQATVANLPQIHAIGEEVRQSQESAKASATAAAISEANAKVSETNAFTYRGEAADARNEAKQIAAGISSLDGSGVTQTVLDLVALLGASAVETDEYLRAVTDAEGRLLFWIDHDGNIGWSKGIPEPIQKVLTALQEQDAVHTAAIADIEDRLSTVKEADNPEWLKVWQDEEGHVLGGIRTDGSFEFFKGIPQPVADALAEAKADREAIKATATASAETLQAQITSNDEDITALQAKDEDIDNRLATSVVDTDEWLQAVTDEEGKLLYGVKSDGTVEFGKTPEPVKGLIEDVDTRLADIEDRLSTVKEADNPEWLKVWQDEDGHVLGGIRTDGSLSAHKLDTTSLTAETINWSDNNMSDLETLLLQRGFKTPAPVDWSEASSIQIPEPRCAVVNIISTHAAMPTSKTSDHQDWMEFWDMQGNYFKKRIINNAQGNSSMGFVKKNFAVDLCNDEWVGDDTFSIKFGDWVPQDSFHCKAYYTDYFRGVAVVSYKLMNEVLLTRGIETDRPWKKALKVADDWGVVPKSFAEGGDNSLELDNGARCFPDGFPVIVHYNGTFYGIFSWQLKKSRQNMYMNKKTAEHIHLDGTIDTATLLNYSGKSTFAIQWNQFEIRNPKNLYCMDGSKYEGDTNQQELIDETSENYDASNKDHVRSKTVKEYIKNLSLAMYEIYQTRANNYSGQHSAEGAAKVREVFEKYFDPENLIDYLCLSDVVSNRDGFRKNWQWATYDGQHWFINLYDGDMSFGGMHTGEYITPPLTYHLGNSLALPTGYIVEFYSSSGEYGTGAMEARYAELRKSGVFTVDHIVGLMSNWVARIGVDNFDNEYERWPDAPCHGVNVVRTDYWKLALNEDGTPKTATAIDYDVTKTYVVGDTCSYGLGSGYFMGEVMGYYVYECVAEATGKTPITQFKYYDSIYRFKNWVKQNLTNMDTLYKYSEE